MRFRRATAIVGLTLLLAACQVTTRPGSPASPTVTVSAGPTAGRTAGPSSGSDAVQSPTLTPGPTAAPSPTSTPAPAPSATISHVVVVWMENREASAVTASTMSYLYALSQTYGRADQFYAVAHPSLPNYLAFWSGSTQGVTDDADHDLAATSLSNQMAAAGRSWRTYAQDYPAGGCNTASAHSGGVDGPGVAGTYARKHNPAMSFTFVSGSSQCANIQPLANFDPNVNFAFVAPNLCNDMHDCSPAQGDAFLRAFLPQVLTAPEWADTLLVVSFDEGTTNANGGGRVFTMVARQGLAGVTSSTPHDHYGLLRTVQDIFGLACLEASCGATPLDEFLP
jgi:phospholipase C